MYTFHKIHDNIATLIRVHEITINSRNAHDFRVENFVSFCLIARLVLTKHKSKLYHQFVAELEDLVALLSVVQNEIGGSFITALIYIILREGIGHVQIVPGGASQLPIYSVDDEPAQKGLELKADNRCKLCSQH